MDGFCKEAHISLQAPTYPVNFYENSKDILSFSHSVLWKHSFFTGLHFSLQWCTHSSLNLIHMVQNVLGNIFYSKYSSVYFASATLFQTNGVLKVGVVSADHNLNGNSTSSSSY